MYIFLSCYMFVIFVFKSIKHDNMMYGFGLTFFALGLV